MSRFTYDRYSSYRSAQPESPLRCQGGRGIIHPIGAPMAAIAIAVNRAIDADITDMPLNPTRVMESILKNKNA